MSDEPADVLIVGAGAAGGVFARRLADAGFDIVCLEQGDWPDRASFPGATAEWELGAAKQWSSDPSVRNSIADYPIDVTESDLRVINFNGVGGGTILYAAQWPRLLPDDFRVRTTDGVADDWPIGYDELLPYYEQTDIDFGVSGLGGNPMYPPGADPPLPPLPIGNAGLRVARAHARLGWHWWPQSNAILSAPYQGRHQCVQRGTCGSGCNEGAKASTDLTHFPHVVANGGRVITGARVVRLLTDDRGLMTGAEWVDRAGRLHRLLADVVVLAANAIGSARLLLASSNSRHPDGLANSSGLVGRRLMLHSLSTVTGLFDEPLEGWQAHSGGLIQCFEFGHSDPSRGFVRGSLWELGTSGGPMRAVFSPRGGGVWGADHHRHVRQRLGRSVMWAILGEDLPEETNRVELSPTVVDSSGLAAPRLTYRLSANTIALSKWNIARATESLEAAGAWHVDVHERVPNGHFMGTARMGDDPTTSVVDRWCVAHDIPNLLVVDGSVFVTSGAANPTSTIAALALRAADHLVQTRRDVPTARRSRTFASAAPAASAASAASAAPNGGTPVAIVEPFSPSLRRRFARVADHLIPAADGMPGAADIAIGGALLDRVLRARPDLAEPVRAFLSRFPDDVTEPAFDGPEGRAVRYTVVAAYYLDERVRELLGYPGTVARPVGRFGYPEYLEEGLLDHLTTR